jgi:hypothetical protein
MEKAFARNRKCKNKPTTRGASSGPERCAKDLAEREEIAKTNPLRSLLGLHKRTHRDADANIEIAKTNPLR